MSNEPDHIQDYVGRTIATASTEVDGNHVFVHMTFTDGATLSFDGDETGVMYCGSLPPPRGAQP